MADVRISALSPAASVATNTVVPVVRSGASVTEKATLEQVSDAVLDAASFLQAGADAVARAPEAKLREFVTPWDFGAVGDGVADDTAAWAAALATGKTVHEPVGGTFRITSGLTLATLGQRVIGAGPYKTTIQPEGSFDVFTITNAGNGVEHLRLLCSGQTGGRVLVFDQAVNSHVNRVVAVSPHNFAYVYGNNNVTIANSLVGTARGDYTVKWFGDGNGPGAGKGTILHLTNFIASGDSSDKPIGMDMDGNVGSLFINNAAFLSGHGYGFRARNTSGGSNPVLVEANNLTVEFTDYGIYIEAGSAFEFTNTYSLGAAVGDAVNVAAGVQHVRFANGTLSGAAGYGINAGSGVRVRAVNMDFDNNDLGPTSGVVVCQATSFWLDAGAFFQLQSGNTTVAFDSGDYMSFDRAQNLLSFVVNSVIPLRLSETVAETAVPFRLPSYTVATLPSAANFVRCMVYVSNGAGNKRLAISDGSNWRWPDGTVVS